MLSHIGFCFKSCEFRRVGLKYLQIFFLITMSKFGLFACVLFMCLAYISGNYMFSYQLLKNLEVNQFVFINLGQVNVPAKDCSARPNEEFVRCGPSCQPMCSTHRQPCNIQYFVCPSDCYCINGFARDASGICIPLNSPACRSLYPR